MTIATGRRRSARPAQPPPSLASESSAKPLWVVLDWIERHCVVPDGFRRGQPFRLYRYQGDYLREFYTVRADATWDPANPSRGAAFVYRRGLLVGPQKVGKNPLIAAQVTVEGVGPALFAGWAGKDEGYACRDHGCRCGWEYAYDVGEAKGMPWATPLIQITAFSEESTENTYDALRPMIELGRLADVIPKTGEEFIRLPGGGRIDTVTSSAMSRLGQRVTFVPQDEVGIWTGPNKMARVADTQYRGLAGMGGRASLTSNAWDPSELSVAQVQYESQATDIYRQFVQPPRNLSYTDKRERHKIHTIVYPPDVRRDAGGHLDLDAIENEAADLVQRDPTQAMRFYGNMIVTGAGHAVDADLWASLAKPRDVPAGSRIGAGFDGSVSRDATVLRGCTPDGYSFIVKAWVRPQGAREWKVDRQDVHQTVAEMFARYDVGILQCDPPKWWTDIEDWTERYGKERVIALDTNSATRFAPAVDRWLVGIREGSHTHDDDPLTNEHVEAAYLKKVRLSADESDGRTLYTIVKGSDGRQIDACIADVLAYDAAMSMGEAEEVGPLVW